MYKIHSGVRNRETKTLRSKSTLAKRARFVQRIGGGDIVVRRTRPATVTEEMLAKHLDVIRKLAAAGSIIVRTPVGQLVDMDTLKVMGNVRKSTPTPKPVADSASNDDPQSPEARSLENTPLLSEDVKVPEVMTDHVPDGVEVEPDVAQTRSDTKKKKKKK